MMWPVVNPGVPQTHCPATMALDLAAHHLQGSRVHRGLLWAAWLPEGKTHYVLRALGLRASLFQAPVCNPVNPVNGGDSRTHHTESG